MENFKSESLKAHNDYRKKHGVPPLKLNDEICKVSQRWADHLIKTGKFEHSQGSGYGENLYYYQSSNANATITGEAAVTSWYNEIKDYTFGKEPSNNMKTGHFTQVVWRDTKELGIAFARSGGKIIVVANYSPPGNYVSRYAENVPAQLN